MYNRWPDKQYRIICPPPTPKRTASEVKEAKEAKKLGRPPPPEEQEQDDQKGVMFYDYDIMFHYLLASLRRADGTNSVTSTGVTTLDIFAGLGQHR